MPVYIEIQDFKDSRDANLGLVNKNTKKLFNRRGNGAAPTQQQTHPVVAVNPNPPPPIVYHPQPLPWVSIFLVFGLTLSSICSMITVFILYMRPMLQATQRAAEVSELAAKDMRHTAEEMDKTAAMFRDDIPLTMQDVQRTAEEWELVGKQLNFLVASVTRPLNPRLPRPGGGGNNSSPSSSSSSSDSNLVKATSSAASDWVGQAGASTANLSKRVASDTSSLASSLWTTVNQLRQQLGWSGLSKDAAEEAKRLVYIGRQQQEARSWIAAWRSRTGTFKNSERLTPAQVASNTRIVAAQQRSQDEKDLQVVQQVGEMVQKKVGLQEEHPEEAQEAVQAVLQALERAQRAAEEAAASSSALERAIEQAESAGALSSDEEEDFLLEDWASDDENGIVKTDEIKKEGGGDKSSESNAITSRSSFFQEVLELF
ncbi:hypothetical protein KSW81_001662 [Nannochloris sp. 'desiccata']|nr:hypothetical protein KSW81_001662 [Chlorella desiccata (nom. nud.)]